MTEMSQVDAMTKMQSANDVDTERGTVIAIGTTADTLQIDELDIDQVHKSHECERVEHVKPDVDGDAGELDLLNRHSSFIAKFAKFEAHFESVSSVCSVNSRHPHLHHYDYYFYNHYNQEEEERLKTVRKETLDRLDRELMAMSIETASVDRCSIGETNNQNDDSHAASKKSDKDESESDEGVADNGELENGLEELELTQELLSVSLSHVNAQTAIDCLVGGEQLPLSSNQVMKIFDNGGAQDESGIQLSTCQLSLTSLYNEINCETEHEAQQSNEQEETCAKLTMFSPAPSTCVDSSIVKEHRYNGFRRAATLPVAIETRYNYHRHHRNEEPAVVDMHKLEAFRRIASAEEIEEFGTFFALFWVDFLLTT